MCLCELCLIITFKLGVFKELMNINYIFVVLTHLFYFFILLIEPIVIGRFDSYILNLNSIHKV